MELAMTEFKLNVENMNCGHCSGMVEKTLAKIEGITEITVDLEGKTAVFQAADESLADQAAQAVTQAGYPASR